MRPIAALLLVASTFAPPVLAADGVPTKQECASAYVDGQRLRKADKLTEAKAKLAICANDACPASLTKDCKPWLDELTRDQPSVALSAIGLDGKKTDGVRVEMDGHSLGESLPASAVEVDPGEHVFRFQLPGADPIELKVSLSRGDKAHLVSADFSKQAPKPETPSAPVAAPAKSASRPIPALVWVLGGVGVVGLGSFAYFGSKGKSEEDDLASSCAPNCDPADVDRSHQKFLIADISLGVSIAAFAGATYLFLTRPTEGEPATTVGFSPLPKGGGAAFVRSSF